MTFRTPLLIALLLCGATQAQPRHDILSQCPALAEQLPEMLATAQRELGEDADVQAVLLLRPDGAPRIESLSGPRRHQTRVRIALQGLECRSAAPQRQLLTIRFRDPLSTAPATASR